MNGNVFSTGEMCDRCPIFTAVWIEVGEMAERGGPKEVSIQVVMRSV